jgi:hypothetical protein
MFTSSKRMRAEVAANWMMPIRTDRYIGAEKAYADGGSPTRANVDDSVAPTLTIAVASLRSGPVSGRSSAMSSHTPSGTLTCHSTYAPRRSPPHELPSGCPGPAALPLQSGFGSDGTSSTKLKTQSASDRRRTMLIVFASKGRSTTAAYSGHVSISARKPTWMRRRRAPAARVVGRISPTLALPNAVVAVAVATNVPPSIAAVPAVSVHCPGRVERSKSSQKSCACFEQKSARDEASAPKRSPDTSGAPDDPQASSARSEARTAAA